MCLAVYRADAFFFCRKDAEIVGIMDRIREGSTSLAASVIAIIYDIINNDDEPLPSSVIALSLSLCTLQFNLFTSSLAFLLHSSYAFSSSRIVMHSFVDIPDHSPPKPCTQD